MAKKTQSPTLDKVRGLSPTMRFVACIAVALVVAYGLIVLMATDKSAENLSPDEVLPKQVCAYQYSEAESSETESSDAESFGGEAEPFEEVRDQLLLGTNPLEASLTRDAEGALTFRYKYSGLRADDRTKKNFTSGAIDSLAIINMYSISGSSIEYHIGPDAEAGSLSSGRWDAIMRVPKSVDAQNPSGTWELYVASKSGNWKHTTWVQVNPDKTGTFGSIDNSLEEASSRDVAEASLPCTVEFESAASGDRLSVLYDGGRLLLVFPRGGVADADAASDQVPAV